VAAARAVTDRRVHSADRWGAVVFSSTQFSPVVDGATLPEPPWAGLAAGAARGVELLIGHTRDEYSLLTAELADVDDADPVIDLLTPTPGAARYRTAFPGRTGNALREVALADWLYRMPALHLAEAATVGGARVWLYELAWGFGPAGASHGLDTLLVYGTTDVYGEVTAAGPTALAEAAALTRALRADHLAFAAMGDPGWRASSRGGATPASTDPNPCWSATPRSAPRDLARPSVRCTGPPPVDSGHADRDHRRGQHRRHAHAAAHGPGPRRDGGQLARPRFPHAAHP